MSLIDQILIQQEDVLFKIPFFQQPPIVSQGMKTIALRLMTLIVLFAASSFPVWMG
jgi:hypothetical protein